MTAIEVNGRLYRRPTGPTLVACLDGVDPRYLEDAFERGITPRLAEMVESGAYAVGRGQLPSFTNPNNLSIVTGAPPVVHGLPGNHYLDPDGNEVQLTDPVCLRAPSIHARFAAEGVPVLAVTTKDKLRRLLAGGGVPCVSAELAHEQSLPGVDSLIGVVGRGNPGIYHWDCSHYALELGLALSGRLGIELLYVSLTDFVQHSAAPGEALSDRYLIRLDSIVGAYLDAGWRVGLVADHGMNAKTNPDGSPRVAYLGEALSAAGLRSHRVILPITDPYVVHHAALGSGCWVHVAPDELDRARETIGGLPGVEEVLGRDAAAAELLLPADRIGDLVVFADEHTVLGKTPAEHDLGALRGPLRSHGGRHEQAVPILLSHRPDPAGAALLAAGAQNLDIHALVLGSPA